MAIAASTKKLQVASESSFAEYASSPGSASWSQELPILDVRWDPAQGRIPNEGLAERQNEIFPGFLGPREGDDLEFDVYVGGHATAPTGSLTATWLYTLLKDGLGGGSSAEVGGTATGASATSISTGTATFIDGGIIAVGAEGDGRCEGYTAVTDGASSPVSLLTALPAGPNSGDAIRAALMAYPAETGHATKRFLLSYPATGQQWVAFGCQLAGLKIKTVVGSLLVATLRYKVAYWARASITSELTMEAVHPAIYSGGQVFYQTVGTTTRNLAVAAELEVSLDLGLEGKPSPNLVTYQTIGGWERTRVRCEVAFKTEWTTDAETLFDGDGPATVHKHMLVQFNRNATGRGVSVYFPRLFPVGARPTGVAFNNLRYTQWRFAAREGTDVTNELTRSLMRIGIH